MRHRRERRARRRQEPRCNQEESRHPSAAAGAAEPKSPTAQQSSFSIKDDVAKTVDQTVCKSDVVPYPVVRSTWARSAPPSRSRAAGASLAIYDVRGSAVFANVVYEKICRRTACARPTEIPSIVWTATVAFCDALAQDGPQRDRRRRQEAAARALPAERAASRWLQEEWCRRLAASSAAQRIQWAWRRHGAVSGSAGLRWWDKSRTRAVGKLAAHVLFLQRLFRAARLRRPGCWSRGGWKNLGRIFPPVRHRCQGGKNLAGDAEFKAQEARAEKMLQWYDQYVAILRRLSSGVTPCILHQFGGGGGSSEGGKRAGACGVNVDNEPQPDYVRRFGSETFYQGDALSWANTSKLAKRHSFVGCLASPPCKPYSRALSGGTSTVPKLIPQTRDQLKAFFKYWAIENVLGAAKDMDAGSVELFGQFFGCRVDRARKIEASFPLRMDEAVLAPAKALRCRTCLGERRRWRMVDAFNRPATSACCSGNIFAVQGRSPWKATAAECAAAMGIDRDHMSYDRLAQSLPPSYTRMVIGQMCMQIVHDRFSVPAVTYDDHVAAPVATSRLLAGWLVGAGDDRAAAGLGFKAARQDDEVPTTKGTDDVSPLIAGDPLQPETWDSFEVPGELEDAFRELDYSHVGGFDQRWTNGDRHWLDSMRSHTRLGSEGIKAADFIGRNTYVEVGIVELRRALPLIHEALEVGGRGTRVTISASVKEAGWLQRLGWKEEHKAQDSKGVLLSKGKRGFASRVAPLDHSRCEKYMDPRDLGQKIWADDDKRMRTWRPVEWNPDLWRDKGLPPRVVSIMTEGAVIEMGRAMEAREVPQYAFASAEARMEASVEADRAIATGHMSYIPAGEVEAALKEGTVHPWTMTQQGEKWRACQDYSPGTNRYAKSAPFGLPTPWDVKQAIIPGRSKFVKYDLRDGFWSVPVHQGSKNFLIMRHPATGRLMRCDRIPFGFIDSPRIFCSVTEAIAQLVRERAAGLGVHCWCYVDDFLLMGDDEEAARKGGEILEQVLFELGMEWAPHKQRGPCSCIEFLGLLIANFEEVCCLSISKKRQSKLQGMLDEWMAKRPKKGVYRADPTELAKLLGTLVFASQVVPGGRVYMQGMLSQFSGLEVDWRRGEVRARGGSWSRMEVTGRFWRDLEWWSECLAERNCMDLRDGALASDWARVRESALTGTDASNWGTGQVAWIDGGKEEARLCFGLAEKRRSINWRELLGIVRVIELYGAQLGGRCVLIETDNTSALGAAEGLHSKSEDMQELVRRILELAEKHDIRLRFTHTPGVKLLRPDQTSRGDPVEEPRARLRLHDYERLSVRFGPFTEFLGAERQHSQGGRLTDDSPSRLWTHPTFTTVGSAMRLIGERLMAADGERAAGILIVPDAPTAQWQSLMRHFTVVGRRPAGDSHLELSRLGTWMRVPSLRPTLVLSFPRAAGAAARLVWQPKSVSDDEGRRDTVNGGRHLPLEKGSMVYCPPPMAGGPGELYMVWADFDPKAKADLVKGRVDVQLAELLSVPVAIR